MTKANVFLLSAASALVALGVNTIQSSLIAGIIEVVLGVACFLVYELTPSSE